MLSGEGMERRKTGEKQQQVKLAKTAFARAAHFFCTFLCRCFARLQRETSRNFLDVTRCLEEMSYVVSFTFFFHCRSFSIFTWHCGWLLAFIILSPPLLNFHVVLPNKKMSPLFFYLSLQISVALFLVEPRWPAAYFLFFLCLFLVLYSKSVDMTVNLSSVLQKTWKQREFPLSVSVFIESSVVSASQGAGSYTISRQK